MRGPAAPFLPGHLARGRQAQQQGGLRVLPQDRGTWEAIVPGQRTLWPMKECGEEEMQKGSVSDPVAMEPLKSPRLL